jgi:CRISPR-associated protein Cmr2
MAEKLRESVEGARAAWLLGGKLPTHIIGHLEAARTAKEAANAAPRPAAGEPGAWPATAFMPNGGILYGACYDTVERLVGAVKLTRREFPRPEDGLKCSLCGERAVSPPTTFEEQKVLWGRTRKALQSRGMIRRGEALCGVCWAKRRYGFVEQSVPSTSEIAATPFKWRVLEALDDLALEVLTLCDAVQEWPGHSKAFVVQALIQYVQRGGLAERFARVAGEVLLGNPREDREEEQEEEVAPERVMRAVRGLRQAARLRCDIDPPRPYLAVLVMDGDEMGKWLSGEKNRPLRDYLSTPAAADLEACGMEPFLRDGGPIWPMTPALHAALSEACAVFSQRTAARTIERDGLPAFLVYAGGDDVLALTPIGCHDAGTPIELATEAARRLRLRFSGHVRRDRGRGDVPDATCEAGYVLDPHDGLGMAFGKHATASAGLAVFHHKWPLGRALEEARRAEERAKDELGRDALAISILRRSGQVTQTGLKFGLGSQGSAVVALQHLCHAFAFGRLSPRFVTEIRRRLADFHGGLEEDALVSLARPLVREAATGHFGRTNRRGDGGVSQDDETALADILAALDRLADASKPAANESAASRKVEAGKNPSDLKHLIGWCDLVEAAAFLGRGEEP